ncbi:hypothetical protein [Pseudoalteromonas sp. R3]|uniref:hypothetical protein n=1 Tax=Pseudoalteromonas sp. R3 TaxID=1709477 RepID=UPI0006B69F0A|nr:hypothetical protein [Pseudoalteromonas sp. R3]AZZ96288.1 hypothetical protein ELR70_03590 [Pseudoalteromonas sp. R3]
MRKFLPILLFVITISVHAESETTVSYEQLVVLIKKWNDEKEAMWYYKGSGIAFHYFHYSGLGVETTYKVARNGIAVEDEFLLTSDKSMWHKLPLETGADSFVKWSTVIQILNSGHVVKIFQSHSNTVTLYLNDGTSVKAQPPQLDDILKEISKCGVRCENIERMLE